MVHAKPIVNKDWLYTMITNLKNEYGIGCIFDSIWQGIKDDNGVSELCFTKVPQRTFQGMMFR